MAAGDLTTLDAVKAWLFPSAAPPDTDDSILAGLITAVSDYFNGVCDRQLVSRGYAGEVYHGTGGRALSLRQYPVTAVSAVTVDGNTIPASAGPPAPGFLFTDTQLILIGHHFRKGLANVTVSYTAGFAAVPPQLAQACVEQVAFQYREIQRIGVSSKAMAGETTAYVVRALAPRVADVLARFTRVVPS